jgi:hypothetical protein
MPVNTSRRAHVCPETATDRPRSPTSARRTWMGRRARVAPSLIVLVLLSGCSPLATRSVQPGTPSLAFASERDCVERHGLPDPRCTPGAIRAGVSLATICAFGYSSSVRPPESYTEPLKLRQMRAYGLPGSPRDYEEDHLVPLSIGGAPRDPRNLWPEPRNGPDNAEQKDQLESWTARMACAGRIPLSRLQQEMATDWTALYRLAGGERVLRNYPPGG